MQGDCDDQAMLVASLLLAIGHPVRLAAVGFHGQALSHVVVETRVSDKWLPLETTESMQACEPLKNVTSRMIEHIKQ